MSECPVCLDQAAKKLAKVYQAGIDLSLVSTDDLLEALEVRHDAIIFAATQNRTNEAYYYIRRWCGGNIICLGMARFLQLRIEQTCNKMDEPDELEDDT